MVDGGEHLLAIAHVSNECGCFTADLGDLIGDGADTVRPNVHQCQISAVACQPQRDPASDAARRTGDQSDLSVQTHDSPFGSTRTFIFVPACSASNPSSITSSIGMRVTHPLV